MDLLDIKARLLDIAARISAPGDHGGPSDTVDDVAALIETLAAEVARGRAPTAAPDEPSMDEILGSIRDILAEDGVHVAPPPPPEPERPRDRPLTRAEIDEILGFDPPATEGPLKPAHKLINGANLHWIGHWVQDMFEVSFSKIAGLKGHFYLSQIDSFYFPDGLASLSRNGRLVRLSCSEWGCDFVADIEPFTLRRAAAFPVCRPTALLAMPGWEEEGPADWLRTGLAQSLTDALSRLDRVDVRYAGEVALRDILGLCSDDQVCVIFTVLLVAGDFEAVLRIMIPAACMGAGGRYAMRSEGFVSFLEPPQEASNSFWSPEMVALIDQAHRHGPGDIPAHHGVMATAQALAPVLCEVTTEMLQSPAEVALEKDLRLWSYKQVCRACDEDPTSFAVFRVLGRDKHGFISFTGGILHGVELDKIVMRLQSGDGALAVRRTHTPAMEVIEAYFRALVSAAGDVVRHHGLVAAPAGHPRFAFERMETLPQHCFQSADTTLMLRFGYKVEVHGSIGKVQVVLPV